MVVNLSVLSSTNTNILIRRNLIPDTSYADFALGNSFSKFVAGYFEEGHFDSLKIGNTRFDPASDLVLESFTISKVSVSGSITWESWEDPSHGTFIWRTSSSNLTFEVRDTNNNQIQIYEGNYYCRISGKFLAIYSESTITPSQAHYYTTSIGASTSSTTFYTGATRMINSFEFNLNTRSDSYWQPSSPPSASNEGQRTSVEIDTTLEFSPVTFIKLKE